MRRKDLTDMNENTLNDTNQGVVKETETEIAKCPACGAKMEFDPLAQKLVCKYCGTDEEIENNTSCELDFLAMLSSNYNAWGDETHVFRCDNCGAKEILTKKEIAKSCPFCGTTNIVETKDLSGLKPNAIIPFSITTSMAGEIVAKWISKRFFAPSRFKKSAKGEDIKGTYSPAFTFDTQTSSTYYGRLGKYYYRTVRRNGKTETIREIRYFPISGNFNMFFDDILIQASNKIEQKDIDKISPFDTNDSKEYSTDYLHGYIANANDKKCEDCWQTAKSIAYAQIKRRILSQYTYDIVDYFKVNTDFSEITYKYVLLPIYVGHSSWKRKVYNFFLNGRNGKITGKTPVSPLKVGIVVLLGLAALVGLGFLIYYYFQ